jgi:hypothetical protein
MSWVTKLNEAKVEYARHREAAPWLEAVKRVLPGGVTCISTRVVLDLIDVTATTGNARKVAAAMRALGFVPLKSRQFMPGGFRGTTTRGWMKPVREKKSMDPAGNSSAGVAELEPTGGYHVISA